jgi:hypothetical protein
MTPADLLNLLCKLDLINHPYYWDEQWWISTVPIYNCSDSIPLSEHPELLAAFEEAGFLK